MAALVECDSESGAEQEPVVLAQFEHELRLWVRRSETVQLPDTLRYRIETMAVPFIAALARFGSAPDKLDFLRMFPALPLIEQLVTLTATTAVVIDAQARGLDFKRGKRRALRTFERFARRMNSRLRLAAAAGTCRRILKAARAPGRRPIRVARRGSRKAAPRAPASSSGSSSGPPLLAAAPSSLRSPSRTSSRSSSPHSRHAEVQS